MTWYLWLIIAWQVLMLFFNWSALGRSVTPTGPGLVFAIVVRGLIVWGLIAAGADPFWLWTVTIVAAFDIVTEAFVIGESTRVGLWEELIASFIFIGTIALAITAGVS